MRGYPIQSGPGGYPILLIGGSGYSPSQVWMVVSPISRMGYSLARHWMGYPKPGPGMGYPPFILGMGYPPPSAGWAIPPPPGPGMGYPPPSTGWGTSPPGPQIWYPPPPAVEVWTDKQTQNSTFSHPSDVGGKYTNYISCKFTLTKMCSSLVPCN